MSRYNIVERAIVPHNPSSNTLIKKEKYNLFVPITRLDTPGVALFDESYFALTGKGKVKFSNRIVDLLARIQRMAGDGIDASWGTSGALEIGYVEGSNTRRTALGKNLQFNDYDSEAKRWYVAHYGPRYCAFHTEVYDEDDKTTGVYTQIRCYADRIDVYDNKLGGNTPAATYKYPYFGHGNNTFATEGWVDEKLKHVKIAEVNDYEKELDDGTKEIRLKIKFTDGGEIDIPFDAIFTGVDKLLENINKELTDKLEDVNKELTGKVDKLSDKSVLYATDSKGNPTSIRYGAGIIGSGVAQRDNDGRLYVPYMQSGISKNAAACLYDVNVQCEQTLNSSKTYTDGASDSAFERSCAYTDFRLGSILGKLENSSNAYEIDVPNSAATIALLNSIGGESTHIVDSRDGNIFPYAFNGDGGLPLKFYVDAYNDYADRVETTIKFNVPTGEYWVHYGFKLTGCMQSSPTGNLYLKCGTYFTKLYSADVDGWIDEETGQVYDRDPYYDVSTFMKVDEDTVFEIIAEPGNDPYILDFKGNLYLNVLPAEFYDWEYAQGRLGPQRTYLSEVKHGCREVRCSFAGTGVRYFISPEIQNLPDYGVGLDTTANVLDFRTKNLIVNCKRHVITEDDIEDIVTGTSTGVYPGGTVYCRVRKQDDDLSTVRLASGSLRTGGFYLEGFFRKSRGAYKDTYNPRRCISEQSRTLYYVGFPTGTTLEEAKKELIGKTITYHVTDGTQRVNSTGYLVETGGTLKPDGREFIDVSKFISYTPSDYEDVPNFTVKSFGEYKNYVYIDVTADGKVSFENADSANIPNSVTFLVDRRFNDA